MNRCGTRALLPDPSGTNDVHAARKELEALREENLRLAEAVAHARAVEKRHEALVNMLVHDLRSPIQGLRLILDFLVAEGDGASADVRKTCLSEAITATRMMARLLDTVLDRSGFPTARF